MSHPMPDELVSYLVDLVEELPPRSIVWKSEQREFTREDLVGEIRNSTTVAHAFCADILRASRDVLKDRALQNSKLGTSYIAVPEEATLEWAKTLKMLVWNDEKRELETLPFMEPEDVEQWEKDGGAPSFSDMIYLIERNGDRVIEVLSDDGSLVYSGRKAFCEEQKAKFVEVAGRALGQ